MPPADDARVCVAKFKLCMNKVRLCTPNRYFAIASILSLSNFFSSSANSLSNTSRGSNRIDEGSAEDRIARETIACRSDESSVHWAADSVSVFLRKDDGASADAKSRGRRGVKAAS